MSMKADGEANAMIFSMRVAFKATLVTLIAVVSAPFLHSADGGESSFTVNINARHPTVGVGQPIPIMVELTNRSSSTIVVHVDSGLAERVYKVMVRNADNSVPEKTAYYRKISGDPPGPDDGSMGILTNHSDWEVGSGKTLSDYADLGKLYNMPPGMYTVQMERLDPATKKIVKSNTITITVIP